MSAFIVCEEHIDAMIRLGLAPPIIGPLRWFARDTGSEGWNYSEDVRELTLETSSEVGQMLVSENVQSIIARYPDVVDGGSAPGPVDEYWKDEYSYSAFQHGRIPTAVEGLKLIDCYEYQSCEHDGWNDSEAKRFCESLRGRLIGRLVGYSDAPWEWTGEPLVTA